jgi:hypothetical protein
MKLYKEAARQEIDYFEAMFKGGQEQGIFKTGNARAHAISLISCLDGFLGYMLIDNTISVKNVKKEIQNIFINNYLI